MIDRETADNSDKMSLAENCGKSYKCPTYLDTGYPVNFILVKGTASNPEDHNPPSVLWIVQRMIFSMNPVPYRAVIN